MPVPNIISTHTEDAYNKLLGQFKDKPIIQSILKTWTDKTQEVEQDIYDLMTKTLFLVVEGVNLQRYGTLLGIPRPDGFSDGNYKELMIAEILRRSSDGTPDRIRQILEATSGMTNMRIFEHSNENQLPFVTNAIFAYGYSEENISDFTVDSDEGKYLKWASPVTTGSVVLGQHLGEESSLFIPCELGSPLDRLHVNLDGVDTQDSLDYLVNNTDDYISVQTGEFDQFGEGYENAILAEFGQSTEQFQVDTSGDIIEDFYIDVSGGSTQELYIDSNTGISSLKGITLEISQLSLTEEIN